MTTPEPTPVFDTVTAGHTDRITSLLAPRPDVLGRVLTQHPRGGGDPRVCPCGTAYEDECHDHCPECGHVESLSHCCPERGTP